jgi:hypothetical protein
VKKESNRKKERIQKKRKIKEGEKMLTEWTVGLADGRVVEP